MTQLRSAFRSLRLKLRRLWYRGSSRACPICGFHARRFLPFGRARRPDAKCPSCSSLERHRLAWLYLRERTTLFDGAPKRVLHVAPEPALESHLRPALEPGYVTADLLDGRADVAMDVTDIGYPDGSFDVIYCSHVLEHVPEDRKAMRELYRVMTPGGWGMINVPITAETTDEDPSVTDPAERLRRFGKDDHVRSYGRDYFDRQREAGFEVEVTTAAELFDAPELERYGIPATELVCICRKPNGASEPPRR